MTTIYFLIGTILGSFICLVAERVPIKQSIISPSSHCSFCQQKLCFFELIPLFSIVFLRFRCRHCLAKIPVVYFWGELVSGLVFMTVFSQNFSLQTIYHFLLLLTTLLLSFTDIYYLRVEPKLFYPLFLLIGLVQLYSKKPFYLLTALGIFMLLALFNHLFPNSLGGGDILLISAFSFLLEIQQLLHLLLIASSTGLLFLLFSTVLLKKTIHQLPFVPFLTFGLFTVLYF